MISDLVTNTPHLPRAHTCYKRIDLPNYSPILELKVKLGQTVLITSVGYDIE